MVDECSTVCGFRCCVNNVLLPYLVAIAPYLVRRPSRVALLPKTKQCTSCSSVLQYSRSFFCITRICHGYQHLSLILCTNFLTIYCLFLQVIYSKPFHISLDMDGWSGHSVRRSGCMDQKKTETKVNTTDSNWTIRRSCLIWELVWLLVALLFKYSKTDKRPVAISCNWSFNYVVHSGFSKLRVQSQLVAVVVAPDQGPKTGLNQTFKHYLGTSWKMVYWYWLLNLK